MNSSPNTGPRGPSSMQSRYGNKLSQRGMLSLLMFMASIGALSFALIGGAKMVYDILGMGLENSLSTLPIKAFVVGLAYAVGWLTPSRGRRRGRDTRRFPSRMRFRAALRRASANSDGA